MNLHEPGSFAKIEKLPEPVPERPRAAGTATSDRVESRQLRRIRSLELLLAAGCSESTSRGVVLEPFAAARHQRVPVAVRAAEQSLPAWPRRRAPAFAMEPPPGHDCPHLRNVGAKVIAFGLFGLSDAGLQSEVDRVAALQARQGDFIPVFLIDRPAPQVFRRRGYVCEFLPGLEDIEDPGRIVALQPRLELLELKWGIDLFINLGRPKGGQIRHEFRTPAERYQEARARLSAGRFASARRILQNFTQDALAGAEIVQFGDRPARPDASIIIVSYRNHPGVEAGLRSISEQIEQDRFEVILVDNGNDALAQLGAEVFGACTVVRVGFNAGCSGARNIGAEIAAAPHVMFLDDDGITAPGAVAALMDCIVETGAVAVRGRVEPLTSPELKGVHYDLGHARVPALITCEGISVWKRDAYRSAGGFDPLLAGHEGAALCARLWRFHGPAAFVYEPSALLLHDYAPGAGAAAAKSGRYQASRKYLDFLGLRWQDINTGQNRFSADPLLGYRALQVPSTAAAGPLPSVSIITTAKNARRFLVEYTISLKAQTSGDFELVFVDDGSDDGTLEEMEQLWQGDTRLKTATNSGSGRGAALNEAMRLATGDVCMIADVDDLSVPRRVALTQAYFDANPTRNCMSFVAFNESNPFRMGPPRAFSVTDLGVRQLFGMPVSFPTFAFRRLSFPLGFDEELEGGIDCDWLFRNSHAVGLAGEMIFFPAVYYREHPAQITETRGQKQREVRRRCLEALYERIIGQLGTVDLRFMRVLTETKSLPVAEKPAFTSWIAKLMQKNREQGIFAPDSMDNAMSEVVKEIRFR